MESLRSDLPLDSLPWELIGEIAKYYDPKTLLAICTTSNKYNILCKDVKVWRNIFLDEGLDTTELEPGLRVEDYIDLYWTDKKLRINTNIILENLKNGQYYDRALIIDPEEQKWGIAFGIRDVIFNDTFNMNDISDIIYEGKRIANNIFLINEARLIELMEDDENYITEDQIQLQYEDNTKRFFIHYDEENAIFNDNRLYISEDIMRKLIYNLLKNDILIYDVDRKNIINVT
ncbi:F-box domain-containing protein [Orpheovirus IHUMI-LCC2]|uniref:F-box domain-containing protein n=1 Tax=Orpheovirus IHUMI-LCC2 TaxID=2023057 RepID=A0A2I2L368_9VIRU|nr:F-box domain-containing protein [Orpheovirus IHUMI-LCC2]SNW61982.1 F-box domain-containing protein [Orpheovirus IHUMI-LCC2]